VRGLRRFYGAASAVATLVGLLETLIRRSDIIPPPLDIAGMIVMGPLIWLYFWGCFRLYAWHFILPYLGATFAMEVLLRCWPRRTSARVVVVAIASVWLATGAATLLLVS
jgi:hypothetical protein